MNKLTKQRRTLRTKQPENKIQTEQEYKEELSRDMENDYKHRHCDCIICDTAHELFKNDPQKFLEERWQDYLERNLLLYQKVFGKYFYYNFRKNNRDYRSRFSVLK